jgi:hypothetical protein
MAINKVGSVSRGGKPEFPEDKFKMKKPDIRDSMHSNGVKGDLRKILSADIAPMPNSIKAYYEGGSKFLSMLLKRMYGDHE